jgi:hypothetical protein
MRICFVYDNDEFITISTFTKILVRRPYLRLIMYIHGRVRLVLRTNPFCFLFLASYPYVLYIHGPVRKTVQLLQIGQRTHGHDTNESVTAASETALAKFYFYPVLRPQGDKLNE